MVMDGQAELRFEIPGRKATSDHTMSVVVPGKAFGWSSLVPPHELTLSVYAGDEGCRFIRMNAKQLMDLFEEHSRIGFVCFRNLTHVVAKRFPRHGRGTRVGHGHGRHAQMVSASPMRPLG